MHIFEAYLNTINNVPMSDPAIRALLLDFLATRDNLPCNSIHHEVSVGQGSVRADVVVTDNSLKCFEIKSKSDSLNRLLKQGWHYNRAFNQITLVAATKHIQTSMHLVPSWWGVYEVTDDQEIHVIREPQKNPELEAYGLSELLTRDESLTLLGELPNSSKVRSKSTRVIHQTIAEICELNFLNEKALFYLKSRYQN